MRHWGILTALLLALAPGAARAEAGDLAADTRVAAALRAGDSQAAADALIEAANRAISGGEERLTLQREGLRPALAQQFEFFVARELRREPPQFAFAHARQNELQAGIQRACAAAADIQGGARVTASRFQTTAAPGAAIASCAFESQRDEDFRWIGVVIRTHGAGGLRMRATFASPDADLRRAASQHLSAILANLANAVQGPQQQMRPAPAPRTRPAPTPPPPPGTTI